MRWYRIILFCVGLLCLVAPAQAETWALLIGVDSYDSSDIRPLKGAVNDTLALKEALIASKICVAKNIRMLTTRPGGKKSDRGTILEEAERLVPRVGKGDTVFVFYSGHGCQDGKKTYLLCSDVKTESLPLVKRTAVDVDDFEDAFYRLPQARVVIAYDMCRIEIGKDGLPSPVTEIMQGKGQDFSVLNTGTKEPTSLAEVNPMLVRWWSCRAGERSYEGARTATNGAITWRGYFSEAVERGIRGAAATEGTVTLAGLERYVRDSVTDAVRRQQARDQHPRLLLDIGGLDDVYGFVLGSDVTPPIREITGDGTPVDLKARLTVAVKNTSGETVPSAVVTVDGREAKLGSYTESLPDDGSKTVRVVVKATQYEPGAWDVRLERGINKKVTLTLERSAFIAPPPDFTPTSAKEILTLKGHTYSVWSATFSPDGKKIVTGSSDNIAKVWDVSTEKEILTLNGHSNDVRSVAFSPDGKRILTASNDNTAKVWDASTGKEILTLNGHTYYVYSAAFSLDGKKIVTGSSDIIAKVWDASTGRAILTLKRHTDWVRSVAFSPDGKRILTGSKDNTAKVWDANTGKEILTLNGHTDWVHSAAFSPDGKHILTGSDDNTAKVWDASTGKEILTLNGHSNWVYSAAFSPDGKRIVTGGWMTAKIWQLQ